MSYEEISPLTFGGAGNGNTYRFKVRHDNGSLTLCACERDVASSFRYAGHPVPSELVGDYDCYGNLI